MAEHPGSEPYDPDNLLDRRSSAKTLEHHGRTLYFCSEHCRGAFASEPRP